MAGDVASDGRARTAGCAVVRLGVAGSRGGVPRFRAAADSDVAVSPVRRENAMVTHPYLRAYMAGIVVPTLGLLVALSAFVTLRLILHFPVPIERAIAFPMAIVPNLWGVWNMLYVRLRQSRHWRIGAHGLLLP